jgi:hypothetical protein
MFRTFKGVSEEQYNDLSAKTMKRQDLGPSVTKDIFAAVMSESRLKEYLEQMSSADFTIKPVEVVDKEQPNEEYSWKLLDGGTHWQILDYLRDGDEDD